MDRALVIGDTGGIGAALRAELEGRGTAVTGLARATGLDVTDEASVDAALQPLTGPYDLIFVATGALTSGQGPEKTLRAFAPAEFAAQMALNALGPMLVLKHALRLMPRDRRAVFVALSARVGSIGDNRLGGWYSYRASKAALNALIHGAAVEIGRSHKHAIVACLHPGTVATRFTANYPDHDKVTPDVAATRLIDVVERLTVDHTGGFFDYAGREIPW